jgi:hypothetical protein
MKEQKYIDLDEETGLWCVFGTNTGKAYASFCSKTDAEDYLKRKESPEM